MSKDLILKATTSSLVSQLTSYAKSLCQKLEKTRHLSMQDYKKTHGLALQLIQQMNQLKSEAKVLGKEISVSENAQFLSSIKRIRARLNYLCPKKQFLATTSLHDRRIKHHQTQSKKLKKKLKAVKRFFVVGSDKRRRLKDRLVKEIRHHETEMEKSVTQLAALSKQFSINY